jgi:hypothetical protein
MSEIKDLVANSLNHSLSQISFEIFYAQESISHLRKAYGKKMEGIVKGDERKKLLAKFTTIEKELEELKKVLG